MYDDAIRDVLVALVQYDVLCYCYCRRMWVTSRPSLSCLTRRLYLSHRLSYVIREVAVWRKVKAFQFASGDKAADCSTFITNISCCKFWHCIVSFFFSYGILTSQTPRCQCVQIHYHVFLIIRSSIGFNNNDNNYEFMYLFIKRFATAKRNKLQGRTKNELNNNILNGKWLLFWPYSWRWW